VSDEENVRTEHGMPTSIVRCPPERLAELFELRARVWIGEGADPAAFPEGAWSDDADARRLHWVALDGDRIVGGASLDVLSSLAEMDEPEAYRIVPPPPPGIVAAPARIVVERAYRGRGIASALLDAQDEAAREAGAVFAARQASPPMARLLRRRGWRVDGPAPDDPRFPGVRFVVMSLDLAHAT
jgi:GNAT superfamily N-acetyltransferase